MLNVSRLFSYAIARNSDKMIHCVEGFTRLRQFMEKRNYDFQLIKARSSYESEKKVTEKGYQSPSGPR